MTSRGTRLRPVPLLRGLVVLVMILTSAPAALAVAQGPGDRDAARRGTVLVSRGVAGGPANGRSGSALVSASGNTVVFSSEATNLVRRRLRPTWHLFAWERSTRRIELISLSRSGRPVVAGAQDVSADGRRVLFRTQDGRLWLRDRDKRTTRRVPTSAQLRNDGRLRTYPTPESGWSYTRAASTNARHVVLTRTVTPSPGEANWEVPFRVWDARRGKVVRSGSFSSNIDGGETPHKLSDNGRLMVVRSGGAHGDSSSRVVDLRTGRDHVPGSDVSGDSRWLLQTGFHYRLMARLTPLDGSGRVNLIPGKPRVPADADLEHVIEDGSVSRDGRAVAYDFLGDGLVPGFRTSERQVYYWRRGS